MQQEKRKAGRPHGRGYPCRVPVRLTEEMHARLDDLANRRGVSLAEVIRVAVAEYIERAEAVR